MAETLVYEIQNDISDFDASKILSIAERAIERPEDMTANDINILSAAIACMENAR